MCAIAACLLFSLSFAVQAQNDGSSNAIGTTGGYSATPPHMWEVGVGPGVFTSFTDINFEPGFGVGLHIRRALDYVFSLRGEGFYGLTKGSDSDDGAYETTYLSVSGQLLISVNNLIWNEARTRKINLYGIVGAGINRFEVDITAQFNPNVQSQPARTQTQLEGGGGIAFRVSEKFNVGIETKVLIPLGAYADFIDGLDRDDNDILNFTSVRLNFNIGNRERQTEPLYWVNPLDIVLNDISELKRRPAMDLADSDGDGVLDIVDREPDTPEGVPVNTLGVTLDSDNDGVPDYQDQEPFSPPGYAVDASGVAQAPTGAGGSAPNMSRFPTRDEVKSMIDDALRGYNLSEGTSSGGSTLADWFLPMIHFDVDSYKIKYSDYGNLANIARVMKSNPEMKVVVTGFADNTGSDTYNRVLSYNRAKAAIDFLVEKHGIPRSRLILNYAGEEDPLVPVSGSSFMNRRVEFRVATRDDREMNKPEDLPNAGKNKFRGNREAGY